MSKKDLNERDICSKLITPAILKAGWDLATQIREEVPFTKGRIIVRGKLVTRGKGKRADYILYYKASIPIAIVEAKDNHHPMGAGLQQGLDYSVTLGIPFVFASNGDGFVFHDKTVKEGEGDIEKTLTLDEFPRIVGETSGVGPSSPARLGSPGARSLPLGQREASPWGTPLPGARSPIAPMKARSFPPGETLRHADPARRAGCAAPRVAPRCRRPALRCLVSSVAAAPAVVLLVAQHLTAKHLALPVRRAAVWRTTRLYRPGFAPSVVSPTPAR